MDEYITRNNAISAVCFGCNQEFSDEPCEPDACAIRQSIMTLPTADVVPKSEVEKIFDDFDALMSSYSTTHKTVCIEEYNELKKKHIGGNDESNNPV